MQSLTVRNAVSSDIQNIVEMHLLLQSHLEKSNSSIWRYTDEKEQLLRQEYEKHLKDENSLILVAENESKIVGFAYGMIQHRTDYLPNNIGWMGTIYVHKGFRRQGVGSKMIQKICQFFRSKNIQQIYLRYVLGNKEGEGFWKHLGFEPILVTSNTDVETVENKLLKKGNS